MLLKFGVNPVFSIYLLEKFPLLDDIHIKTVGRECIITSGNDGRHIRHSFHYWEGLPKDICRAIDIRTNDLSGQKKTELFTVIKNMLDINFDVILKDDHIHIEYDPS